MRFESYEPLPGRWPELGEEHEISLTIRGEPSRGSHFQTGTTDEKTRTRPLRALAAYDIAGSDRQGCRVLISSMLMKGAFAAERSQLHILSGFSDQW